MRLLARKLGKSEKHDLLTCTRVDGSVTQVAMPRHGILPHDLVHSIVESVLPFRHGFMSQVADGGGTRAPWRRERPGGVPRRGAAVAALGRRLRSVGLPRGRAAGLCLAQAA